MAASAKPEVYDLLILVDATYSMSSYIEALQKSLPKIISISQLTRCFSRIGLLAYRDYSEDHREKDGLLEWSGWCDPSDTKDAGSFDKLMHLAQTLEPIGGGDYPEATKTGLAKAYEMMQPEATTIILLYTDAPPHVRADGNDKERASNQTMEANNLSGKLRNNLFPVAGHAFVDWVSAANTLRTSAKKAHVLCFLDSSIAALKEFSGYYSYLSAITHGACFYMTNQNPSDIAQVTVDVLLAWMGVEKPGAEDIKLPAALSRYINGASIKKLKNEVDPTANDYFWASGPKYAAATMIKKNITHVKLTTDVLRQRLPKKKTPASNFAQRYKTDTDYRLFATEQIEKLIKTDVTAIGLNPVFGSLWRAVCNDRENPQRDSLLNKFSREVENIEDDAEKSRMKAWLEESYDYKQEIMELIDQVPDEHRYPCVFLDPTLRYSKLAGEDEDDKGISSFTRDELLEIGRSCDYRVLRRLGKVLTQLSYVDNADELPEHVANADVQKIPLVLGTGKYGNRLFRILLHLIVEGTMLAVRPSAVLAALVLNMRIKPLMNQAANLMLSQKSNWADLTTPETWNTSCLSLLLDADNVYKSTTKSKSGLLPKSSRTLFEKCVAYKLAEANLNTVLLAKVGWTPEKTTMAVGPVVTCASCRFPRSVTIMVEKSGGRCGICVANDYESTEEKEAYTKHNVTKDDTSESSASWVECSDTTCRAQYVVYNGHKLNVRAKCFYCRERINNQKATPWIECNTCLNRIIWPTEFRDETNGPFSCVACDHGRKTIVVADTSAVKLNKENGIDWLLRNDKKVLADPFNKRTLFHVISTTGIENFAARVDVLPDLGHEFQLTMKGKIVQNTPEVREQLLSWINRRQAEAIPCGLCFSDFHHSKLRDACGRKGCNQRICEGCLKSWYGTNSAGRIINPATLHCPFCRRPPAAKTLAAYGMGIHAVGDLKLAVEERGSWIHAWCMSCSRAKRHIERSCAQGAPPTLENFICELCIEGEFERLRLEEEAARLALEAAQLADREAIAAERRLRSAARNRILLERPVKDCPGCEAPSQKISGCDHVTCPLCSTHWCWACGEKFEASRIYQHMNGVHNTYYAGGDHNEDAYDSEDWDSD